MSEKRIDKKEISRQARDDKREGERSLDKLEMTTMGGARDDKTNTDLTDITDYPFNPKNPCSKRKKI